MLTDWRENNGRANTNKVLRMRRAPYCFFLEWFMFSAK